MKMTRTLSIASVLLVATGLALSGCTSKPAPGTTTTTTAPVATTTTTSAAQPPTTSTTAPAPPTSNTPVLSFGKPDGPQTNNSNPWVGSSAARTMGYAFAIYEPLVQANTLDPTAKPTPWLATDFAWNADYTSITYTIRDGVKWSDGQAFSADDVVYSVQQRIDKKALNAENLDYKAVSASGNKVTIDFNTPQFVNQNKVYGLFMVPKHIWSAIADPTTDTNQKPVGTGPYVLDNWTAQAVILKANPTYWGGAPSVPTIQYQEFNDNTGLTNALVAGQVQWGWSFIANYKTVWVAKDPAYKAWYPSGLGIDALWYNTVQGPFADKALRVAATMVIDRGALSVGGSTGAAAPLTSVTGLPLPVGQSFIPAAYQGKEYATDLEGAKKVLTDAGYTGVGTALKDRQGKAVSVKITDPAGWNDYNAEQQIIADAWKALGIDAQVDTPTADAWFTNIAEGNFDAAIHWTDGGSTPYDIYSDMMNGTYVVPVGQSANYNFGRYQNDAVTKALADYAAATADAARGAALTTIIDALIADAPTAPLLTRPSWGNYSTKYYTGWPSADDPYSDINMTLPAASLILTKLKAVA